MDKNAKKQSDVVDALLKMQMMSSWSEYTGLLKSADEEILSQFQKATRKIQSMIWVNIVMGCFVFVAAVLALVIGGKVMLDQNLKYVGVSIFSIGFIVLLIILFRNPLKGIQRTLSNLAKIQIIFHGYVRQVTQIDTVYKQTIFFDAPEDLQEKLKVVYNIQEAVEQSVDEVTRSIDGI